MKQFEKMDLPLPIEEEELGHGNSARWLRADGGTRGQRNRGEVLGCGLGSDGAVASEPGG